MYYTIPLNSNTDNTDTSGGYKSRLTYRFSSPLVLSPDRDWSIRPIFIKYPLTIQNISTELKNNTFRYSLDAGANYTTVTIADGTYDADSIINVIASSLITNSDYADPAGTGDPNQYIYPFNLYFNDASGRSFFIIRDYVPSSWAATNTIIDLSNSGTSLIYSFLGYTLANSVLSGSSSYVSDTDPDFYGINSEIYINVPNLVQTYSSAFESTIFIGDNAGSTWSAKYYYSDLLSESKAQLITNTIDYITVEFVNSVGELIKFRGTSIESNTIIFLQIVGTK